MMDMEFDGDWATLFDAPSQRLRSVFLGDPARADAGVVELVQFLTDDESGRGPDADAGVAARCDRAGFFLLSCYVDVEPVLERLRSLGLGGAPRRITVGPGRARCRWRRSSTPTASSSSSSASPS